MRYGDLKNRKQVLFAALRIIDAMLIFQLGQQLFDSTKIKI